MSEVIDAPHGRGNFSFGSEDIAQLAAGLESALANLGIKDRNDPTTTLLAKLIIQLAKMASAIRRAWRKGRSGLCAALVVRFTQPEGIRVLSDAKTTADQSRHESLHFG